MSQQPHYYKHFGIHQDDMINSTSNNMNNLASNSGRAISRHGSSSSTGAGYASSPVGNASPWHLDDSLYVENIVHDSYHTFV